MTLLIVLLACLSDCLLHEDYCIGVPHIAEDLRTVEDSMKVKRNIGCLMQYIPSE